MRHYHECVIRVAVTSDDMRDLLSILEPCGQAIWIAPTVRCARYNLIGVPARHLDVLAQDGLEGADGLVALEVVRKEGKFDGSVRTRLCLRRLVPGYQTHGEAALTVRLVDSDATVTLARGADVLWSGTFPRLRAAAYQSRARELVMWHWSRYFRHLDASVAERVADGLVIADGSTITSANREASNRLYEESVALGWRKLTRRERLALGYPPDAGQWQRESDVAMRRAARAGLDHPSGTGEHTRGAACGPESALLSAEGW